MPDDSENDCFQRIYGPGAKPEVVFSAPGEDTSLSLRDVSRLLQGLSGVGLLNDKLWSIHNAPLIRMLSLLVFEETVPREILKELGVMYSKLHLSDVDNSPCISLLSNGVAHLSRKQKKRVPTDDELKRHALSAAIRKTNGAFAKEAFEAIQSEVDDWHDLVTSFIISAEELESHGFPKGSSMIEATGESRAYIKPTRKTSSCETKILAIDCEMCQSEFGKELCRISVADAMTNEILLDSFVKPENEIIDYLTPFSGISEEDLVVCSTSLTDIQESLLENFIFADTILVGHSLENDLQALHLEHHRIIDTSILYPKAPPAKHSLKYLSSKFLNRIIQSSSHDSTEDAVACADLLKLKIINGRDYGLCKRKESILMDLVQHTRCTIIDRPSHISNLLKEYPALQRLNRLNLVLAHTFQKVKKRALTLLNDICSRKAGENICLPEFMVSCCANITHSDLKSFLVDVFQAAPQKSVFVIIFTGQSSSLEGEVRENSDKVGVYVKE